MSEPLGTPTLSFLPTGGADPLAEPQPAAQAGTQAGINIPPWKATSDLISRQQFGVPFDQLPPSSQSPRREAVYKLYEQQALGALPINLRSQATVIERFRQGLSETIRNPEVLGVGQFIPTQDPNAPAAQQGAVSTPIQAPTLTPQQPEEDRGFIEGAIKTSAAIIGTGLTNLVTGAAGLVQTGAEAVGLDTQDSFLEDFIRRGNELRTQARGLYSQDVQNQLNAISQASERGAIAGVTAAIENPLALAAIISESIAGLGGAGKLVQAANRVAKGALTAKGATGTTIGVLAATEAGNAGNEARQTIEGLSLAELREDGDFRALEARVGAQDAQRIYGQKAAEVAAMITGAAGALSFIPGFRVLEDVATGTPVTTTLTRAGNAVRVGAAESAEEFVQEAAQTVGVGLKDPTVSAEELFTRASGAGAVGAVAGGIPGTAAGLFTGQPGQPPPTTPGTAQLPTEVTTPEGERPVDPLAEPAPPAIALGGDPLVEREPEPEPVTTEDILANSVREQAQNRMRERLDRENQQQRAATTPGSTTAPDRSNITTQIQEGDRTAGGGTPVTSGTQKEIEEMTGAPGQPVPSLQNPDLTPDQRDTILSFMDDTVVGAQLKRVGMSDINAKQAMSAITTGARKSGQGIVDAINKQINRLEAQDTAIGRIDANKLRSMRDAVAPIFDAEADADTVEQALVNLRFDDVTAPGLQTVEPIFKNEKEIVDVLSGRGFDRDMATRLAPQLLRADKTGNPQAMIDAIITTRDNLSSAANIEAIDSVGNDLAREFNISYELSPVTSARLATDVPTDTLAAQPEQVRVEQALAQTDEAQETFNIQAADLYDRVRASMVDPIDGLTSLLLGAGISSPGTLARIVDNASGKRDLTRVKGNNISTALRRAAQQDNVPRTVQDDLNRLADVLVAMRGVQKTGGGGATNRRIVQENQTLINSILNTYNRRAPPLQDVPAQAGTEEDFREGAAADAAPEVTMEGTIVDSPEALAAAQELPFYPRGSGAVWQQDTMTKNDIFRRRWFDQSWAITKVFQNRPDIKEDQNVMLHLGLMVGKTDQINDLDLHTMWTPLYQTLYQGARRAGIIGKNRVNGGLEWRNFLNDISNGLIALHAPERNLIFRQIRSRYDANIGQKKAEILKGYKNGVDPKEARRQWDVLLRDTIPIQAADETQAGMSNEEASRIIADLERRGLMPVVRELQPHIHKLTEKAIINNEESGRFGDESAWIREFYGFENYIPLKGGLDQDDVFAEAFLGGTPNAGFTHTDALTEGRQSDADNVFYSLRSDLLRSGRRIAEADVLASLKNAVEAGIIKGTVREIEPLEVTAQGFKAAFDVPTELRDKVFIYREGDDAFAITLQNDDITIALKQQYTYRTLDGRGWQIAATTNRIISRSLTSYNPLFWPKMFLYDAVSNMTNLVANFGAQTGVRYLRAVGNPAVLGAAIRYSFASPETRSQLAEREGSFAWWANKYEQLGGGIGHIEPIGTEAQQDKILGNKVQNLFFSERAALANTGSKQEAFAMWRFLRNGSAAFEAATRVPAFRILSESGQYTDKEAAFHTKKLMDFSQQGEMGKFVSAYLVFGNTALIGADRAWQAIRPIDPETGQRRVNTEFITMGLAASFILVMMQDMQMGGEDDEENAAKKKEFKLDTLMSNIIVGPEAGEGAFVVPLAPGLPRIFKGIAEAALAFSNEDRPTGEILSSLTKTVLQSTTPIPLIGADPNDIGPFVAQLVAPSVIRPLVDLGLNESAFGGSIYSEYSQSKDEFAAKQGRAGTPEFYKTFALAVARGSPQDFKIDLEPEVYKYITDGYLGGWSNMVSKLAKLAHKANTGQEIELPEDVPIMSSLYTRDPEFRLTNEFFRISEDINDLKKIVEDQESTFRVTDETMQNKMKIEYWEDKQQEIINLIQRRNELQDDPLITPDQVTGITNELNERIKTEHSLAAMEYTEVFKE